MLPYKEHLQKTAGKLKSHNNLLMKLAGSSWGANAGTLTTVVRLGSLLFSSRVLCSSLVTFSSHRSHWCPVERHYEINVCPAPLPWLQVLANIEPPPLSRKAASAKLVEKAVAYDSWPIHCDILYQLPQRLSARNQPWHLALMVISHLVVDPTIRQPGFDLRWCQWSLLNCFHTVQSHCGACRKRWRQVDSDLCACGEPQTMSHIINCCMLMKLADGLSKLNTANDDAVAWLTNHGGP